MMEFLRKNNAALIYKLHPIEQTAFSGREFIMNPYCFELTDEMLFDADIRYDELLNAFDVMMSDYSSIAFDFLILDRPLVYLIPDYEEYKSAKGFVFRNVDYYMPGPKAFRFGEMIAALSDALEKPEAYARERQNVRNQRFDFMDDKSAQRSFRIMMDYCPVQEEYKPYVSDVRLRMPSSAEHLQRYIQDEQILLIDSTKEVQNREEFLKRCHSAKKIYYITGEIPNQYRRLSSKNLYRIADMELFEEIRRMPNAEIVFIEGGVDYEKFSLPLKKHRGGKTRIGFAGTIDNRIYFAMVQYLCESFPECDIVFAGDIIGDYPGWLRGYENLHYMESAYDELPEMIQTFDVAILPFFGGHKKTVPSELFQYLACGKPVVASDMPNLPNCRAIYISKSIADSVDWVKRALQERNDKNVIDAARHVARQNDWAILAEEVINSACSVNIY